MRRFLVFGAVAGMAALVCAQMRGSDALNAFSQTLGKATSLNATYTFQKIGDTAAAFKVDLAKPNKARLETPKQIVVADGTTVTIFDKQQQTYFKQPQNDAVLRELFKADEFAVFKPFFLDSSFEKANAKAMGQKNRRGENLNVVTLSADAKGRKTITFYLSEKDNLAKQAEFKLEDQGVSITTIFDAKTMEINAPEGRALFAFNPPAGARELSLEELNSAKWFHDLEEAKATAKKTGKKIFVDFMASWCGPCKVLDAEVLQTEEFKKLAKHFVFVKIDVDEQPAVSKAYGITAMPTQMVLDSNGAKLSEMVGYGGPARFYSWINGSVGN